MTLYQFLLILRARYRVIFGIIFAALLAALAANMILSKTYTAQTNVLVDARSSDPIGGNAGGGAAAPNYLATQIDIIGGDRVAQRVVKMLKLDEDPRTKESWLKATEGRGTFEAWIADSLKRKLDARPARESSIINIIYKDGNAETAAQLANAFAQAYLDINLSLKTEPAHLYAEWFDEQTKASRANLEAAQARLSDFQQKAGIVTSDERLDYETAKLGQISSQLTAVQGDATDSQSKRNAGGNTVEVMQSPLINSLKADVARLEAQVQELRVNLGVNNPQRQRAESQLASLKSQLGSETARITASINTTYRVSKDRERELQGALAAQKTRVLNLNKQRDELNVYRRDVEAAQRAYEAVSQSASQTRLQSLSTQTNVVRLDTAAVPLNPSSPKTLLNLLVAAFAGTLLGVAYAVLLELVNRRVRSTEDLVQMLDLPVLATISSNDKPRRLPGSRLLMLGNGKPA